MKNMILQMITDKTRTEFSMPKILEYAHKNDTTVQNVIQLIQAKVAFLEEFDPYDNDLIE